MKRIRRAINSADVNRFRFYIQLGAFALFIYGGYLAIDVSTYVPTFACPFAGKTGGTCYLMPLQHQVNIPYDQILTGRGIGLLTGLIIFSFLFILFNKAWCGFLCPLGTVQDWITKLRRKGSIRYSTYSGDTFKKLSKIKYVLLLLLILIPFMMSNSLLGLPKLSHEFATPYCMICPGRTTLPLFMGDISQLAIDFSSKTKMILTALGMIVTGLFFTGAFVKKRFFCLFCPMSGLQYLFSKLGLLRLSKYGEKCTRCGNCYQVCDVGIRDIAEDIESRNIVRSDCMMCFKCVASCPEEGCLKVKFLGIPIYESTEEGFFTRMERKSCKWKRKEQNA